MRIEICAALGSGKSTLAAALAEKLGMMCVNEPVENHPFLKAFYANPKEHYFEKALFFVTDYIHQVKKTAAQDVVFDASLALHKSYIALGTPSGLEKDAFEALYKIAEALPPPQLVIHIDLPSSTVMERIRNRSRNFENGVDESFVRTLQQEISRQVQNCNVPVLRLTSLDIVNNQAQLDEIATAVRQALAPRMGQRQAPPKP